MAKLNADAEALSIEVKNKQKELSLKRKVIESVKAEIEALSKKKDLRVSEHAVVRYFERVKGFDMVEVQKDILSKEVIEMVDKLGGNGKFPSNGFVVVVKDHVVTTVV